MAQPAQSPDAPASWTYTSWLLFCTRRQRLLWSGQSVLVSEERLFHYQRQTYRAVQGRLQEYWRRYKAREHLTIDHAL